MKSQPFQLTTLSQSSLQDYMDCAQRFKLRYLDRLSYPAAETEPTLESEKHQQEGEYFHRLLQQYLIGIPAEQIAKFANTPNLQRWWENFQNSKDLTRLQTHLQAQAESGRDLSGLYPEATLSAPLGKYRLLAKYDLIALQDGKATIYDWKTYRKHPRAEWLSARMQTRVYRALLVRAGTHLLHGIGHDNGIFKLDTRAGEIYFVSLTVRGGYSGFRLEDPTLAKRQISECCGLLENWAPGQRPLLR